SPAGARRAEHRLPARAAQRRVATARASSRARGLLIDPVLPRAPGAPAHRPHPRSERPMHLPNLAALRLPAVPAMSGRVLPLVRRVGPYGWIALGLAAGALAAHQYLRRTRRGVEARDEAIARWEGEGGG